MAYNSNSAGTVQSNTKLGFKVGTQSALDTMLATCAALTAGQQGPATHGSFYLTSDTHRLYIGNSNGTLSPVNEGIITVNSLNDMPEPSVTNAGQFYYINGGESDPVRNVLTVSNGHQWVHINANTNTYIESNDFSTVTIDSGIQVTNDISGTDFSHKVGRFRIVGANGVGVTQDSITATIDGHEETLPVITITGDTYALSTATPTGTTNTVQVKLDSSSTNNDSSITIKSGNYGSETTNNVNITNNNGKITISAKDSKNASLEISNGNTDGTSTNGFNVTVTDNYSVPVSGDFDPKIKLVNQQAGVSFVNGTATINAYTTDEIDQKMTALNAMTYKGTLGTGGSAGITLDSSTQKPKNASNTVQTVDIGDTYLVTSSGITYNDGSHNIQVPGGSLMIARGTEGSDGHITGRVAYDIVASTSDTDTNYNFVATEDGLILQGDTASTMNTGQLAFAKGAAIDLSFNAEDVGTFTNGKQTVTITHKNVKRTNTNGTAVTAVTANNATDFVASTTIPVITAVTSDAQGHVTGVQTTNYTIKDSNSRITESVYTSGAYTKNSGAKKVGTITHSITEQFGGTLGTETVTSTETFSSESLTITTDNTNGATSTDTSSVPGLNIELLWGSF